jgi:hypothetical protein
MLRSSTYLAAGFLTVVLAGCWHPHCNEAPAVGAANSYGNSSCQPCKLVGNAKPIAEGCYDAITGQPVPCPPMSGAMGVPGVYPGLPAVPPPPPGADVLPFPGETIPSPSVPSAQPSVAPGFGMNSGVTGQPVRITPTK